MTPDEITGAFLDMALALGSWPPAVAANSPRDAMREVVQQPWLHRAAAEGWTELMLFGVGSNATGLIVDMARSKFRKFVPAPQFLGSLVVVAVTDGDGYRVEKIDYGAMDWGDAVAWWKHPSFIPEIQVCQWCDGNHSGSACAVPLEAA